MFVHSFNTTPTPRNEAGAALPPNYKPPQQHKGHAMRTCSGVLIGAAVVRATAPAANDECLTLVPHEMTADDEHAQNALLNRSTARPTPLDYTKRVIHLLRTNVRARRLLRDAVHESTVKRLVAWL